VTACSPWPPGQAAEKIPTVFALLPARTKSVRSRSPYRENRERNDEPPGTEEKRHRYLRRLKPTMAHQLP
jgi:hypothetical protein